MMTSNDERKIWYAVQESREDAWDDGSHDLHEAVQMLAEQGSYSGLIAVIDEDDNYCIDEIEYKQLFGWDLLESSVYDKDTDEITLIFSSGLMARGKAPEESFEDEHYFESLQTVADFAASSTIELSSEDCEWENLWR